jgi:GNAT superfamily N-acetyltransferase/beta-phosphoglucomutase-like phosphatase (HAD superfamily)
MHAVIFDIDGTLLHSAAVDDALYRQAVGEVLGDVTLRASLHDYEYVTDTGIFRTILDDNGIVREQRLLDGVRSRFVALLEAHIETHGPFEEIPGARELLRNLSASPEHAVAMATGGWRQSAELKLLSAGIDFEGLPLVTANDHHERTAIMEKALARLGSDFASVSYYGDGPWDRAACAALGWQFVAVGTELDGLESYIGHTPVFQDIRTMCRGDMDAVFHVRTSVAENRLTEDELHDLGITRQSIAAMIDEGDLKGWVSVSHGEVVGFALATVSTREIYALFVLPEHSGRGVGQALLDIAVYFLRRTAPGTVRLRTDPTMPAYRFYLKRGWKDTGAAHKKTDDVLLELE